MKIYVYPFFKIPTEQKAPERDSFTYYQKLYLLINEITDRLLWALCRFDKVQVVSPGTDGGFEVTSRKLSMYNQDTLEGIKLLMSRSVNAVHFIYTSFN